MTDFEQGLDSISPILLRHQNWTLPWMSLIPYLFSLFWVSSLSTLSDTSKPQLTPSIRSCKLWCQARALLAPVPLATKMSASKLIHYFSSHPVALDSSPQLHQITSPCLLLTGRLISLSQMCRLVLVLLLMLLLTQSNSSPTSELPFLILFLLCLILREALSRVRSA